jgi:hypothetical protein
VSFSCSDGYSFGQGYFGQRSTCWRRWLV